MSTLQKEVACNGYAFIEQFMPSSATHEVLCFLGQEIKLCGGHAVHQLVPKKAAPPNTYSGIFGCDAFPMHTDLAHWHMPPRYLMLRCLKGFGDVATFVVDGNSIVTKIGETILSRSLVQPRRPMNGKLPLLRLYQRGGREVSLLRWDETYIRPATPAGVLGVSRFKELLGLVELTRVPLTHPADTLIIDNWRVLHGRSAVPDDCSERIIERAYLGALK